MPAGNAANGVRTAPNRVCPYRFFARVLLRRVRLHDVVHRPDNSDHELDNARRAVESRDRTVDELDTSPGGSRGMLRLPPVLRLLLRRHLRLCGSCVWTTLEPQRLSLRFWLVSNLAALLAEGHERP